MSHSASLTEPLAPEIQAGTDPLAPPGLFPFKKEEQFPGNRAKETRLRMRFPESG